VEPTDMEWSEYGTRDLESVFRCTMLEGTHSVLCIHYHSTEHHSLLH